MLSLGFAKRKLKRVLGHFGVAVRRGEEPEDAFIYNRGKNIRLDFDFVLRDFLMSRDSPDGVRFLQVGAFDGTSGDPLHDYICKYDWEGLLIEPQPRYFQQLQETYADEEGLEFVQAAVDHERGRRTLYVIADPETEDMPDWAGQIASFDRDTFLSHSDEIPQIEARFREEEVRTVNLMALLEEESFLDLDIIQIDVEGFDNEVLQMVDFSKLSPSIVHFEHRHLSLNERLEALDRLIANGFRISTSGPDTVAYCRP